MHKNLSDLSMRVYVTDLQDVQGSREQFQCEGFFFEVAGQVAYVDTLIVELLRQLMNKQASRSSKMTNKFDSRK